MEGIDGSSCGGGLSSFFFSFFFQNFGIFSIFCLSNLSDFLFGFFCGGNKKVRCGGLIGVGMGMARMETPVKEEERGKIERRDARENRRWRAEENPSSRWGSQVERDHRDQGTRCGERERKRERWEEWGEKGEGKWKRRRKREGERGKKGKRPVESHQLVQFCINIASIHQSQQSQVNIRTRR
ncbi:uncharacterized protein BDW47DRAFT_103494 [Aspergillus candidus]|uniref:Uncharacterized protein n=1 Tax=Aspergillus candidus TaxID=41067 RepID=A0A2I2FFE4_ASPCN|nr:hypothetical protein BDW47DRAFT_103494 [Aspergillus candidus]PLB39345.1 hypothetical protein BDW47DRAFT_103494 [Aspergillus candidus]